MSVLGVGIDVVHVPDFAEQLATPGTRLLAEAFTAGERADVADRPGSDRSEVERLAARYAAKEAFVKAWAGARFGCPPSLPTWAPREVEVVHDVHGRPALALRGEVAQVVRRQLGDGWRAHVSLSHDGPTAAAVVVLDGPDQPGGVE